MLAFSSNLRRLVCSLHFSTSHLFRQNLRILLRKSPLTQSSAQRLSKFLPQSKEKGKITTNENLSRARLKICSAETGFCICPASAMESTQRQGFRKVRQRAKTNRASPRNGAKAKQNAKQPREETALSLAAPSCFS